MCHHRHYHHHYYHHHPGSLFIIRLFNPPVFIQLNNKVSIISKSSMIVKSSTVFPAIILHLVISAALEDAPRNTLLQIPEFNNRPLLIKLFPAVENYQSDLYEVYAEPYNFDLRSSRAIAVLQSDTENPVKGEIFFLQQHPPVGAVIIRGNITDLPPGQHGLHVYQSGDLRQGCEKLGGHYNPFLLRHGGPRDPVRHVGDLGNIEAGEDGVAEIDIVDPLVSLTGGLRNIIGRAIVITTNPDDLGRGDTADSLTDGDAGKPLACGVIAYIR